MAPVRTLSEFVEQPLTSDRFVRVPGARVIDARYDLLQHDFAELKDESLEQRYPELRQLSEEAKRDAIRLIIDQWLLDEAAFVSEQQADQTLVNSPIFVSASETTVGYRAPRYGRAAILPIRSGSGLLDIKGIGVPAGVTPHLLGHSDGLLSLKDAIHDWYYEQLVRLALTDAGIGCDVLPNYAVLDLGFTMLAHAQPACLLVRRAHTRPAIDWGDDDPGPEIARMMLKIELALRRYGLTSVHGSRFLLTIDEEKQELRWNHTLIESPDADLQRVAAAVGFSEGEILIEGVNLQCTSAVCSNPSQPILVDLGQFKTSSQFSNPIYSCARANYALLEGEFLCPDDPEFTQPDPQVSFTVAESDEYEALAQKYSDEAIGPKELKSALDVLLRQIAKRFPSGGLIWKIFSA